MDGEMIGTTAVLLRMEMSMTLETMEGTTVIVVVPFVLLLLLVLVVVMKAFPVKL